MQKSASFFLAMLFYTFAHAQKVETIYRMAGDSAKNLYVIVHPARPLTGYLFLVPGMFQKPMDVLTQTDLPRHAAQQGILTIIPTFQTGISSIGIDSASQASLLEMLGEITGKYKLTGQRFYLGGFSIGGTAALKYAELALANNFPIKPSAVFAIDSPLDFERMYNTMAREKRLPSRSEGAAAEGDYMLKRFETTFGGPPSRALASYHKLSPYSFNDTTQQAIKPLVQLPIRLYTEPDVHWWLSDGCDYSGMNAFDFAALTNELKRMGSTKITLITTENKGYRKPGNTRHPHSWSIADPRDLVNWLLTQQ